MMTYNTLKLPNGHIEQRKRAMAGLVLSPQHDKGADLSQWCGSVFNQLQEGSCSACETRDELLWRQNKYGYSPVTDPDVQILYYFGRTEYGDVNSDGGSTVHDAHKAAIDYGVWASSAETYSESTLFTKPTGKPVFHASSQTDLAPTTANVRASLDGGTPVGLGVGVDQSLFNPSLYDGMHICDVTQEVPNEGHAIFCVAYKPDISHTFLYKFQNSWGTGYGDGGFAWFTEAYLQKYLYELGTLDIPKPGQPAPKPQPTPSPEISAYFAQPSVKAGTNNVLTILGTPGTHYTVEVTSPALPQSLGAQGTIPAGGQANITYMWPTAGVYTFTVSDGTSKTVVTATWQ